MGWSRAGAVAKHFDKQKSFLRDHSSILCQENGIRLKGMTRLKGGLYGNPALQGGGVCAEPCRLEDGIRLKGGP